MAWTAGAVSFTDMHDFENSAVLALVPKVQVAAVGSLESATSPEPLITAICDATAAAVAASA